MLSAFAGGRLFGERSLSEPPRILALHGWRGDHAQIARVIDGFPAISIDLPGFGKTPRPNDVWGAAQYAEAVAPVLDEFAEPPVVVGYSFGGRVAVNLAALHPQSVRSLVLVGVPLIRRPSRNKPPIAFRAAKLAHRVGLISDSRMEAERRKRGSADYRAATGIMRDIFVKVVNESYAQQLAAISCPVELVWGEADTEAPLRHAHDALEILQKASLTTVPGATHWSIVEQPEAVRAAMQRCLS